LRFNNCTFKFARALNLLSSDNLEIKDVSIRDSMVQSNHLIYISEVRDLEMIDLEVSNTHTVDNIQFNLSKFFLY